MKTSHADLINLIHNLNEQTHSPTTMFADLPEITYNLGHYYLEQSYGGVSLAQVVNEHGAITEVFATGTKAELAAQIRAMLTGIKVGKEVCIEK